MKKARIEDVSEFVWDGTHGSPVRVEVGVPVLSAQNVKHGVLSYETDRFTTEEEFRAFNSRMPFKAGDLLLTIVGTIGRTAILTEVRPLVFQRSVAIIRPRSSLLNSRFFFHATQVQDFQSQLARSSNTSSQAGVYLGKIKEVTIPLPPLAEQKRIAAILDAADALRAKRRESLAQLDSLLQSTFLTLFGDPVTNPLEWPVSRLGDVFDLKHGFAFKSEDFAEEGKYVLLTPGNFYEKGGFRDRGERQRYHDDPVPEDYILQKMDLLVAMTEQAPGLLGSPILVPESGKFLHNQRLGKLVKRAEVESLYVFELLNSHSIRARIQKDSTGTKVKHTSPTKITQIEIGIPPLPLQQKFAAIVESIERQKTTQRAHLAELDALFAALQHRAFRGEM